MIKLRSAVGLTAIAVGVGLLLRKNAATQKTLGAAFPLEGAIVSSKGKTPYGDVRLRTFRVKNLEDRIEKIRDRVDAGLRDPGIYTFARSAVNKKCGDRWCVPEKDDMAELRALYRKTRDNVRYTSDIRGIDSYQNPQRTLDFRTGDCDDYSSLACAIAGSIGFPCRLKAIRTKGAGDWNHIYAQMGVPKRAPEKWVSFDASIEMGLGWEAPKNMVADARVFPV